MENAGAGAANLARELLRGRSGPVVCLVGPGGNGGDALVLARHLAIDAIAVRIAIVAEPVAGDAALQLRTCDAMRLARTDALIALRAAADDGAALVVDGIYGTGLTRAITGRAADAIAALAGVRAPVLALDLPSGLDCDRGIPLGPCVRADLTATFAAPKLGFLNPESRAWTGEVRVIGIGAPTT